MSETIKLDIVDARVIQMEDFGETLDWCAGDGGMLYEGETEGQNCVYLGNVRGVVSDWIVKLRDGSFTILSDERYKKTFYAASQHRETFSAVFQTILAAMSDGSADLLKGGANQGMIAETAALRVMELTEKN
jgi:hypothetical protein